MKKILVIEDEEVILKALKRLLERNHYSVQTATTVKEALDAQPQSFDLVLADLRLPGAEGTEIIPAAEAVPVLIMTSHASVRSAVDAMRHGATDYIAKPFDHDELLLVIDRALKQNLLKAQNQALRLELKRQQVPKIDTYGPVLETLLETMHDVLDNQQFLHIYGERGTEREALARELHNRSLRAEAPFVVADIGPDTVKYDATTLLGNVGVPGDGLPPGGLIQAAQNGTLVLRHPEFLSHAIQDDLSNAFNQGSLLHPSNGKQRLINVAVITIAQHSIDQLVESKQLNPSLAELFSANQYEVMPLRQRPEDIKPLATAYLETLSRRNGFEKFKLHADAESALRANHWPGNVAELRHVLARGAYVARSTTLRSEDLGFNIDSVDQRDLSLDEYFKYFVLRNQHQLSETSLAARLGISRKALWERRQKMKLMREADAGSSSDGH